MRITIEFDEHEPDGVVVHVTRERAQSGTATAEASVPPADAGAAPAEALSATESGTAEATDAGPAPESGGDVEESSS